MAMQAWKNWLDLVPSEKPSQEELCTVLSVFDETDHPQVVDALLLLGASYLLSMVAPETLTKALLHDVVKASGNSKSVSASAANVRQLRASVAGLLSELDQADVLSTDFAQQLAQRQEAEQHVEADTSVLSTVQQPSSQPKQLHMQHSSSPTAQRHPVANSSHLNPKVYPPWWGDGHNSASTDSRASPLDVCSFSQPPGAPEPVGFSTGDHSHCATQSTLVVFAPDAEGPAPAASAIGADAPEAHSLQRQAASAALLASAQSEEQQHASSRHRSRRVGRAGTPAPSKVKARLHANAEKANELRKAANADRKSVLRKVHQSNTTASHWAAPRTVQPLPPGGEAHSAWPRGESQSGHATLNQVMGSLSGPWTSYFTSGGEASHRHAPQDLPVAPRPRATQLAPSFVYPPSDPSSGSYSAATIRTEGRISPGEGTIGDVGSLFSRAHRPTPPISPHSTQYNSMQPSSVESQIAATASAKVSLSQAVHARTVLFPSQDARSHLPGVVEEEPPLHPHSYMFVHDEHDARESAEEAELPSHGAERATMANTRPHCAHSSQPKHSKAPFPVQQDRKTSLDAPTAIQDANGGKAARGWAKVKHALRQHARSSPPIAREAAQTRLPQSPLSAMSPQYSQLDAANMREHPMDDDLKDRIMEVLSRKREHAQWVGDFGRL